MQIFSAWVLAIHKIYNRVYVVFQSGCCNILQLAPAGNQAHYVNRSTVKYEERAPSDKAAHLATSTRTPPSIQNYIPSPSPLCPLTHRRYRY